MEIAFWTLAAAFLVLVTAYFRFKGTSWSPALRTGAWFCFVLVLAITIFYVD